MAKDSYLDDVFDDVVDNACLKLKVLSQIKSTCRFLYSLVLFYCIILN